AGAGARGSSFHSHPRRRARGDGRGPDANSLRRQHEAGYRPRPHGAIGRRRRPGGRRFAIRGIVCSSRERGLGGMNTFLTIIHILVCVFLILVVLLQAGKGGGMGIAFGGGGGSQTVFGSSGAGNFLTRLTSI